MFSHFAISLVPRWAWGSRDISTIYVISLLLSILIFVWLHFFVYALHCFKSRFMHLVWLFLFKKKILVWNNSIQYFMALGSNDLRHVVLGLFVVLSVDRCCLQTLTVPVNFYNVWCLYLVCKFFGSYAFKVTSTSITLWPWPCDPGCPPGVWCFSNLTCLIQQTWKCFYEVNWVCNSLYRKVHFLKAVRKKNSICSRKKIRNCVGKNRNHFRRLEKLKTLGFEEIKNLDVFSLENGYTWLQD